MKLVPMAHLVAVLLCPQIVSHFKHKIAANGSSRRRDSLFSDSE
jgi:hypothetical protein